MSLTAAQAEGDIPSSYDSCNFTISGFQATTPHGTAVTEAIYDLVPDAEFYLYKIVDGTDFENAKDSCIKYGINIINHSMGWYNASYYDGTGPICEIADSAISNGICWVNSAGNEAETHYRSVFADAGDKTHDFSGSVGKINYFGPGTGPAYNIPAGSTIDVFLNWDAYPTTTEDYDLELYYWTGSTWNLVASSTNDQAGGYSYPTEQISHVTTHTAPYGVVVREDTTTTDHDFTLFNWIASFNYQTASSSITDPSSATDVISVGAIDRTDYTSGPQEDFSSQGPTTDGRTKPDVAAPDNCICYAYGGPWSGTSLSSPHTAGVCALIKSRYPGYSNSDIRSYLYTDCTVDLETAGKDNIYGWGKVVMPYISLTITSPNGGENWQVASSHDITWTSSGTSDTVHIEYSTNNGSSWSDVIAIIPDTGAYSWTIPDTPSDSCFVRIIDTIGSPSDTSDAIFKIFSTPFTTVISPNGGEDWQVGSSHDITWTSGGTSGDVQIEYSINNGSSWTEEVASTPDVGTYSWTVPDAPSGNCLVRVSDTDSDPSDVSDAIFTISPVPYITVTSPNGAEDWQVGSSHDITWISSGTSGTVHIEYSTNNGSSWSDVITSTSDNGTHPWTIPNAPSGNCLVRVSDTDSDPSDVSDAVFTISPVPFTTVISPNGGENWQVGSSHDITWASSGTSDTVHIEYSANNGSSWSDVIAIIPDTGAYSWTIPDTPSDSCFVRITDTIGSPSDTSDAIFTISPVPYITVTSPNGAEDWQVGSSHDITWTSSGTSDTVHIEYSTNNGSSWSDVIAIIPDTGAYSWTIPDTPSDSCFVRIIDTVGSPSDTSDAIFAISPAPYITVITPNGGEDWGASYSYDITWTSNGTSGGVHIEYSANNGSSWSDVIASIPDTGVYSWTIPDTPSDSCFVRITDTVGSPSDTSDAIFTISPITSIPIAKLPEVYSFDVNGITGSNQFKIKYALPEKAKFILEVYDIKGTKMKEISEESNAGYYSRKIDMRGNPAGVYFIRMKANREAFTGIRKVILIK